MAEPQRDAIALQLDMAARRGALRVKLDHLREAMRRRISPREQLRAHPRVALGLVLLMSVPLIAIATITARVRSRRHRQVDVRWRQALRRLRA